MFFYFPSEDLLSENPEFLSFENTNLEDRNKSDASDFRESSGSEQMIQTASG